MKKLKYKIGDLLVDDLERTFMVLGIELEDSPWFTASGGKACYKLLMTNWKTDASEVVYFHVSAVDKNNCPESIKESK